MRQKMGQNFRKFFQKIKLININFKYLYIFTDRLKKIKISELKFNKSILFSLKNFNP